MEGERQNRLSHLASLKKKKAVGEYSSQSPNLGET